MGKTMRKMIVASALLALAELGAADALGTKEGFLLGLDWNLSAGKGESVATDSPVRNNGSVYPPAFTSYFDTLSLNNGLKLVLGFQRYSAQNSALGFNIKAKIGLGFAQITNKMTKDVIPGGYVFPSADESVVTSYIPLTLGIEGNFLYDFFERGAHALGLSLGLGFELMHGIGLGNKFFYKEGQLAEYADVFNASSINHAIISPKIGLYYYYGRHQFGLDVRFDKTLGRNFTTVRRNLPNSQAQIEQTLALDLGNLWSFGLGYAYRF